MKLALLLIVVLFSVSLADISDVNNCTYTSDQGKVFDLSPLISRSDLGYTWSQSLIETSGNLYTNPNFSDTQRFDFQLQICQNIGKPIQAICNASESAMFMYNPTTKSCTTFGHADVAVFHTNPFNDGVYLNYFDGDTVDHIVRYEVRVYFVCQENVTISGPRFEHLKESYQGHVHIFTKYAC